MTRSDAYLVHLALVIAAAALIWRTRDAGRSRRARPWLAMAGLAAIVSFAVWSWGRATLWRLRQGVLPGGAVGPLGS